MTQNIPTVYEGQRDLTVPENRAAAIDELAAQVSLIRESMERVLVRGVHYGTIPGTNRPSLWQPGAELICQLFQFQTQMERSDQYEDWERGIFAYTYRCRLLNRAGELITEREATCSTEEKRYKEQQQERVNRQGRKLGAMPAAEMRETIVLMAQKRAYVAAVRAAGACSAIFTQDDDIVPDQGGSGGGGPEWGICPEHKTAWFQRGNMKSPAHPIESGGWCNKPLADAPGGRTAPAAPPVAVPDTSPLSQARSEGLAALKVVGENPGAQQAWVASHFPELADMSAAEYTLENWGDISTLAKEFADAEGAGR